MEDDERFTVMEAINMCVTVIAFNCDNARAVQMLVSARSYMLSVLVLV